MKDKKWLKEIVRHAGDEHLYINIDMMLKLIDQLDEPEVLSQDLPVIPKFVADWIEALKSKEINMLESIYDFIHEEDINDYMREKGNVLMRAWLDGFTVEKEQKYYVKFREGAYLEYYPKSGNFGITGHKDGNHGLVKLTEDRIKSLPKGDVLFEHFAVPVEELEE